jgi:hypothetical protein
MEPYAYGSVLLACCQCQSLQSLVLGFPVLIVLLFLRLLHRGCCRGDVPLLVTGHATATAEWALHLLSSSPVTQLGLPQTLSSAEQLLVLSSLPHVRSFSHGGGGVYPRFVAHSP